MPGRDAPTARGRPPPPGSPRFLLQPFPLSSDHQGLLLLRFGSVQGEQLLKTLPVRTHCYSLQSVHRKLSCRN